MSAEPTSTRYEVAMSAKELRTLIAKHLGHRQNTAAAKLIGVHRLTLQRWVNGRSPINAAYAALIRDRILKKVPSRS